MHKTLLCVLASMLLALSAAAHAPVLKAGRSTVEEPVQAGCVGNRRSYRSFRHCWGVIGRLNPRNAGYCHRICNSPARR